MCKLNIKHMYYMNLYTKMCNIDAVLDEYRKIKIQAKRRRQFRRYMLKKANLNVIIASQKATKS